MIEAINYPVCSICEQRHPLSLLGCCPELPGQVWPDMDQLLQRVEEMQARVSKIEQTGQALVTKLLTETQSRTARMQGIVQELLKELRGARCDVGWDVMVPEDTEEEGVGWELLGALRDLDGHLTWGLEALLALIEKEE
jgi:hypothetical protein